MKWTGARLRLAVGVVALVLAAGLAGCSGPTRGRADAPFLTVPLETSFATTTGSVAVVAMGTMTTTTSRFPAQC